MKKLLKLIFKIVVFILVIGLLIVQYLKSDFNQSFDQMMLSTLKSEIKKADSLPKNFIEVYNKIIPITNTNGIIFDNITERYYRECPCLNLSQMTYYIGKNSFLGNSYILAWKLEKDFTQKQCLNLYLKSSSFLYGNKGIFEASKFYFEKTINELNFYEMATLALMTRNPSQYNPKRNPEKIKEKISKIKNKLNN